MKEVEAAQVSVLSQHLLTVHGPVMGYPQLAQVLGTTPNALRVRKTRLGDLPPPISGLTECLWPTPAIAVWLLASQIRSPEVAPSRRGRPRLQQRREG
jgi:hypothetical protein